MKKPLPARATRVALAATEAAKVYVVDGQRRRRGRRSQIDKYDPPSDGWRARWPCRKGWTISASPPVVDGKIITVGGFIGSVHRGAVSDVYEYNPATEHVAARFKRR